MKMLAVVIDGTSNVPGQTDNVLSPNDIHNDDKWMFDINVATNALLIWRWLSGEEPTQTIKQKAQKYRYYGNIRSIAIHNINGESIYFNGVGINGNTKLVQQAAGTGTSLRIRDAYRFLAERFDKETKIVIFGFSRGAYAARSLAGFINHVGLPKNRRLLPEEVVNDLFASYRSGMPYRGELNDEFGRCAVEFVGAFDTVGSLAFEKSISSFHNISPQNIRCFRHALALDERRRSFKPDFFDYGQANKSNSDIKEVWFAGAHSNIGGGYSLPKLSSITLIWMMREFEKHFSLGKFEIEKTPSFPQEADKLSQTDEANTREFPYIRDSYQELLGAIGKVIDLGIGKSYRTVPDEHWHMFHPSVLEWLRLGNYCPIARSTDGKMITTELVGRRLSPAEDWPID